MVTKILLATLFFVASVQADELPNIIFLLLEGTSMDYANGPGLSRIRNRILDTDNGINFPNMMVTTPICCPSRTSIHSGMYMHNHGTVNNTVPGLCQNGPIFDKWVQSHSYGYHLNTNADYYTCHVGNYLIGPTSNPAISMDPAPGWENWRTDPGHQYYHYTLNENGEPEYHGDTYQEDYHALVIKNHSLSCIEEYVSSGAQAAGRPFHITVSTSASHSPSLANVAPEYQQMFSNYTCPRTPDFNYIEDPSEAKHWIVSGQDRGYNATQIAILDEVCRNKMRQLVSIDDTFEAIMSALDDNSMTDNAYTILSGDHGYYVGQYGMSYGKMMPYDSSTRVPLWVSGPGIDGSNQENMTMPALNIDIAPTFLDMAGLDADPEMDGISLLPYMTKPTTDWIRDSFLIEYEGLHGVNLWPIPGPPCADRDDPNLMLCFPNLNCICQDGKNNTYDCLRKVNDDNNMEFCMFKDDVSFEEYYDLNEDPYQLHNTAYTTADTSDFDEYRSVIDTLKTCQGTTCNVLSKKS